MCLTSGKSCGPPYKCCCCCSILVGVVLIAIFEVLALIMYIQFADVVGILCSVAILGMFVLSCAREHFRYWLFLTYAASFAVFVIT